LEKRRIRALSKPFPAERLSRLRLGFRLEEAAASPFVLEMRMFCGIGGLGAGAFMVR